jgi:hypothetical protein
LGQKAQLFRPIISDLDDANEGRDARAAAGGCTIEAKKDIEKSGGEEIKETLQSKADGGASVKRLWVIDF